VSFAVRFGTPRREEITELARKYDTIADLRARREAGSGVAPRAELAALARAFPGALRELDTLPPDVIEERRAALGAALQGAPLAPWVTWMIAYHATMRAALYLKARLARAAQPREREARGSPGAASSGDRASSTSSSDRAAPALSDDRARDLADEAARRFDLPIDDAFVHAVARPPTRRVNAAVFARLGCELGVDPDVMWQALFPSRRPARF
jgi:hypothetical protein